MSYQTDLDAIGVAADLSIADLQKQVADLGGKIGSLQDSNSQLNQRVVNLLAQVDSVTSGRAADNAASASTIADLRKLVSDLQAQVVALTPKPVPVQVTGPNIVRYQDLPPKSTITATLAGCPAGSAVSFPVGRFEAVDFGIDKCAIASSVPTALYGFPGGGTVFTIKPKSSTKAAQVAAVPSGQAVLFNLFTASGQTKLVQDIGFEATDQGHIFDGARMNGIAGGTFRRCPVSGVIGSGGFPPYETFGINLWRCPGGLIEDCDVDGGGKSSTFIGLNSSPNATVKGGTLQNQSPAFGAGIAAWLSDSPTYIGVKVRKVHNSAFHSEKCGGVITVQGCDTDQSAADVNPDSDVSSAKVRIIDPVLPAGVTTVRVRVADVYPAKGGPNKQLRSDVQVFRTENGTLVAHPEQLVFV